MQDTIQPNGTDIRLVGSAHPTVYQHFQRSQFAYVSAIAIQPSRLSQDQVQE
ncbi:MAG: hypothetical protein F6K30_06750 [Cyanothece sp. SIO2G6]|nr:hypothetical protein [Cyanothece sp. SIO2G6]